VSIPVRELRDAAQALARGDLPGARVACMGALKLSPNSADALNLLGLIEYQHGDLAQARRALEAAVAAHPRYANAWRNLAQVCAQAGDAAAEVQAERLALEIDGGDALAFYNLGVRAHRAGLYHDAVACFERALEFEPRHQSAMNNLAVALDAARRFADARAAAERLLAFAPRDMGARHTFAAVYSRATEPAQLARALDAALSILATQTDHAGAHECAAIVLGKLGRFDDAIAHARAAVAAAPQQAAYAYTLARLLQESDRLDEANAALDQALARHPDHALLWRERGTVCLRGGDAAEAARAFRTAAQAAPDDQRVIAQLGLALYAQAQADAAHALLGADRFVRAVRLALPEGFADTAQFNAQLAHDIRQHSRLRFEPVGLAAKGGYLTEDLLADRTPAILGFERSLRQAIDAYIGALREDSAHPFLRRVPRRYELNLWATRVAEQGVIDTHIHEESWLSGAYYVTLPPTLGAGEDHAGWLEFGRPHRGLPAPPVEALQFFRPEVGTLLLFPSYLYHRTLPFDGAGERISISFDLAAR
jgi:uncharacterized protein (TIGR02466 family)